MLSKSLVEFEDAQTEKLAKYGEAIFATDTKEEQIKLLKKITMRTEFSGGLS